eukprot:g9433.t1
MKCTMEEQPDSVNFDKFRRRNWCCMCMEGFDYDYLVILDKDNKRLRSYDLMLKDVEAGKTPIKQFMAH